MDLILVEKYLERYPNTNAVFEECLITAVHKSARISYAGKFPLIHGKLIRGTLSVRTALQAIVLEEIVSPLKDITPVPTIDLTGVQPEDFMVCRQYGYHHYRYIKDGITRVFLSATSPTAYFSEPPNQDMLLYSGWDKMGVWLDCLERKMDHDQFPWSNPIGVFQASDSDIAGHGDRTILGQVSKLEGMFFELPVDLYPEFEEVES